MIAPRAKLWSTPMEVVDMALKLLNVSDDDIVYDIGCGDGRFIIECAKRTNAKVFGIEIDATRAEQVAERIKEEGVQENCKVICANALNADYTQVGFDAAHGDAGQVVTTFQVACSQLSNCICIS